MSFENIRSKPSTPEYREGWDRIFGKKEDKTNLFDVGYSDAILGKPPQMIEDTYLNGYSKGKQQKAR